MYIFLTVLFNFFIARRKPANKPRRLDQEGNRAPATITPETYITLTSANANDSTPTNANLLNLSLLYNKLSESGVNSDDLENSSASS